MQTNTREHAQRIEVRRDHQIRRAFDVDLLAADVHERAVGAEQFNQRADAAISARAGNSVDDAFSGGTGSLHSFEAGSVRNSTNDRGNE